MKKHRPSLAYKRQMQPNRTYTDLRQKHKAKIADWMFRSISDYYREHGKMPEGGAVSAITDTVYQKIVSTCIWVPYDEVHRKLLSELPGYEIRIRENGLPEKPPPPSPQPTPKKKGSSNKVCPNCGRKMKQQFIGLQHCRCGISWKKGDGFFERSGDMVFALQRRKAGKKVKQCPVIRYKDDL